MRGPWTGGSRAAVGALALMAMVGLGACAAAVPESELVVFGAASLRDVLRDLEAAWSEGHPETGLVFEFEGSDVLAAQIAEGAPADVFISAAVGYADELVEQGMALGDPVPVAANHLTIVTPLEDRRVRDPMDLAAPGVRLVAAGPGVPISRYAAEVLAALSRLAPDPRAFLKGVDANTVSRETNVRAAMAKVELGEADAAIVYATDALASDLVREVPLPPEVDVAADYAAVAVTDHDEASDFVAWLTGSESAGVLRAAGFLTAGA